VIGATAVHRQIAVVISNPLGFTDDERKSVTGVSDTNRPTISERRRLQRTAT
jgi:hypothetical protein